MGGFYRRRRVVIDLSKFESMTLIRPANEEDAPSVKSLAGSLATTFEMDGVAFDEAFIRIKDDPDTQILVAIDEFGVMVGYLLGFVHDTFFANGPVAWIEEMYVKDTARRSGVGSSLEREFEVWARRRTAKLVALATRRAATFYTAIGYEESATYFKKDVLELRCRTSRNTVNPPLGDCGRWLSSRVPQFRG